MDSRTRIRKLVIARPYITIDEIMVVLQREGFMTTRLAASTIREDFRQSWKLLHKHGLAEDLHHYQEKKQQKRLRNTTKAATSRSLIKRGGNAMNRRTLPDWMQERIHVLTKKHIWAYEKRKRQIELDYQEKKAQAEYERRKAREYLDASFESRNRDRPHSRKVA